HSYPLKRSILDQYLNDAGLTKINSVNYYFNLKSSSIIIRGDYCGESRRGWLAAGFSSIYLWAVPLDKREEIKIMLLNEALAALIEWLCKAEREGNVWRAKSHQIDFYYKKRQLLIKEW
ncbi:MAG: hypothetical protein ACRC11_10280, partial [Xenococcaceae cyanobacterium]